MSFPIDDGKLLEKYKTIWTKIDDLKNIDLNALPVYDDRYIKLKIRIFGDKVYTNFCALNEDDIENKYYEKKYYLQVYLDNCLIKL